MSLDKAIDQLETVIVEVRQASLTDDKTTLGSALALRRQERLINEGSSEFDVVAFGDLNDFKSLNDENGHEAGDIALRKVGETLKEVLSKNVGAKAFRQSGDEFVILLSQQSVERFLSAVASFGSIVFSHRNEELKTAMSIGYALSDGKASFQDLIERAEVACHHAKSKGDGTCVKWSEDLLVNPLVRISARCGECGARVSCNVPKETAPSKLRVCPCCTQSLLESDPS